MVVEYCLLNQVVLNMKWENSKINLSFRDKIKEMIKAAGPE